MNAVGIDVSKGKSTVAVSDLRVQQDPAIQQLIPTSLYWKVFSPQLRTSISTTSPSRR